MSASTQNDARHRAELAARESYGRLIATLASRTRDIAGAEDALADAFNSALLSWPQNGVPQSPEAWLLTAARRNLLHQERHQRVVGASVRDLVLRAEERAEHLVDVDNRLRLLFVCAHPAIDETTRTPLMLQTVLGMDAERIASAFLVAPSTMGQRLSRAKKKVLATQISFELPEESERAERTADVLRAVYVAYSTGWSDFDQASAFAEEAIYLGRALVALLPEEPEAKGLLALMLYCESRRAARRDQTGCFVPLAKQDSAQWDRKLIAEAESLLTQASQKKVFGRFQCEAAIQSVHVQRAVTGKLQHDALRVLYDLLLRYEPCVGVLVARAACLLEANPPESEVFHEAEQCLEQLSNDETVSYQPYWITRALAAERRGDLATRRSSLERALGLTQTQDLRLFLQKELAKASSV